MKLKQRLSILIKNSILCCVGLGCVGMLVYDWRNIAISIRMKTFVWFFFLLLLYFFVIVVAFLSICILLPLLFVLIEPFAFFKIVCCFGAHWPAFKNPTHFNDSIRIVAELYYIHTCHICDHRIHTNTNLIETKIKNFKWN